MSSGEEKPAGAAVDAVGASGNNAPHQPPEMHRQNARTTSSSNSEGVRSDGLSDGTVSVPDMGEPVGAPIYAAYAATAAPVFVGAEPAPPPYAAHNPHRAAVAGVYGAVHGAPAPGGVGIGVPAIAAAAALPPLPVEPMEGPLGQFLPILLGAIATLRTDIVDALHTDLRKEINGLRTEIRLAACRCPTNPPFPSSDATAAASKCCE